MEKKKNVLNDLCLVPNPGPGPAEIEATFYHNLVNIDGTWYCDVILTDERINNPRLITVKYENVQFQNDDDRKTWSYILRLAGEQEKKREGEKRKYKKIIKKITTDFQLFLN